MPFSRKGYRPLSENHLWLKKTRGRLLKNAPFPELSAKGVVSVYPPNAKVSATCTEHVIGKPAEIVPWQSCPEHQAFHSTRQSLKASLLSFENFHSHGTLFADFLRARKEVFIEEKKWLIPSFGEFEFDQYDTPACRWIVVHEYGEVVAGIRVIPTTARCGMYSYMIRDAQLGLIQDIPRDVIFFPAPRQHNILEASRIFVTRGVPACRRLEVHTFLFDSFQTTARALRASHALGIVPKAWRRWIRRINKRAVPAGPTMRIGNEVCQAVIFNIKYSDLRSSHKQAGRNSERDRVLKTPISSAA